MSRESVWWTESSQFKEEWSTAPTGSGTQSVMTDGTGTMLELSAVSWDMKLKVKHLQNGFYKLLLH